MKWFERSSGRWGFYTHLPVQLLCLTNFLIVSWRRQPFFLNTKHTSSQFQLVPFSWIRFSHCCHGFNSFSFFQPTTRGGWDSFATHVSSSDVLAIIFPSGFSALNGSCSREKDIIIFFRCLYLSYLLLKLFTFRCHCTARCTTLFLLLVIIGS